MIRTLKGAALGAVAAVLLAGAPAEAAKRLKKGPVTLDPKLGYVLVRVGPSTKASGKAPNLYIWRFDQARSEIRTGGKKDPARIAKGEDASATFGDRPFMATGDAGVFITSVTPGDYVIHGTESTCFCLGSYAFTVKPGEITDIGTVLIGPENGESKAPELGKLKLAEDILEREFAVNDAMIVRAAAEGDPLPAEVKALPLRRAELKADVRFPNRGPVRFLYPGGLLINRAEGLGPLSPGDGRDMVKRLRGDPDVKAQPLAQPEEKKEEAGAKKAAAKPR
jgi:hypothetical protein